MLLWIAAPIVFFSFSGSKLPGYILPPIFPAVALIIGGNLSAGGAMNRGSGAPQFLTAALTAAAGIGAGVLLQRELGVARARRVVDGIDRRSSGRRLRGIAVFQKSGRVATLYLPVGLAVILVAATHLVFPGLAIGVVKETLADGSKRRVPTSV